MTCKSWSSHVASEREQAVEESDGREMPSAGDETSDGASDAASDVRQVRCKCGATMARMRPFPRKRPFTRPRRSPGILNGNPIIRLVTQIMAQVMTQVVTRVMTQVMAQGMAGLDWLGSVCGKQAPMNHDQQLPTPGSPQAAATRDPRGDCGRGRRAFVTQLAERIYV